MKKVLVILLCMCILISGVSVAQTNVEAEQHVVVKAMCDKKEYKLNMVKFNEEWYINAVDLAALADVKYGYNGNTDKVSYMRKDALTILYNGDCIFVDGTNYVPAVQATIACGIRFCEYKGELRAERLRTPEDLITLLTDRVFEYDSIDLSTPIVTMSGAIGFNMVLSEWYKMLKGGLFSEIIQFGSGETYRERYESAMYSLLEFDDDIGSLMETIEDGDELLVKFNKFLTNGEGLAEAISKEYYKLFKGMSKDEAEWQVFLDGLDEYGDFASIRYFLEDYAVVSNVIDSIGGLELISDITCLYDAQASVLYAMEDVFTDSETEYASDAAKIIMARYEKEGIAIADSIDAMAKSLVLSALDEIYEKDFNMEIKFSEHPKLFLIQVGEEVVFEWILKVGKKTDFYTLLPVYSDLQLDIKSYFYKNQRVVDGAKLRGAGIMYLNAALHCFELLEFDKNIDLSSTIDYMNKELADILSYEEDEYLPNYDNADLIVIAEMGGNVTDDEKYLDSVDVTSNEEKSLLSVGDYIQFDNDTTWQVINIEDNIATLFFVGYFQGAFDASLHMEAHTISLMRYHTYGSATWEHSDVRQWLNSRDLSTKAVDVAFDYSNLAQGISAMGMSAIVRVESDQYAYSEIPGFLCTDNFNDKEYWLIEPTEITSIVPYTQIPGSVVSASSFENFKADMDVVYSEKVGQTKTIDRMFLLSGREIKEYLLDNGLSPYVFTSGKTYPAYWLRDSVYYDLAGYYFYYGTNILTVNGNSAGEKQADMSAGIRPACNINLAYVIGVNGEGTADNPYKLDISDSVINRPLNCDNTNTIDSKTYYATSGGKYYHAIDNCNGMVNPSVITEAEAVSIGKKACPDCIGSNDVNDVPHDHNWKAATCTEPQICTTCFAEDGVPLGHNWKAATCTEPQICTTCFATDGVPLGHYWPTIDKLAHCTKCSQLNGSIVNANPEWLASSWTDENIEFTLGNGKIVGGTILTTSSRIKECYSITLCLRIHELIEGNVLGDWGFYIRDLNGQWHLADTFVLAGDYVEAHFEFDVPISFDAWLCPCHAHGDSWNFSFSVWLQDATVFEYNGGM